MGLGNAEDALDTFDISHGNLHMCLAIDTRAFICGHSLGEDTTNSIERPT